MVPDPEVATPLWLWASQEKVLVRFKPGQADEIQHVRVNLGGGFSNQESFISMLSRR